MTDGLDHIVVVGASAAGLTAAETVRRDGFDGRLTLIGDEQHLPYDRPPLSKQVLTGLWQAGEARLRSAEQLDALGADLRLATRATALDTAARTVTLADGERVGYDVLVIATGLRARQLRSAGELGGVHLLRTVDDAVAIRDDVDGAHAVVVVGAGVLGCELAASIRQLGPHVTVIDPAVRPMATSLDNRLAGVVHDLHADHGTVLRLGIGVAEVRGSHRVEEVLLDDGATLACDVLVVAIGAVPATDWLRGSSLDVNDGVVCDSTSAAGPGVYAAGDVARWFDVSVGALTRVEHRMNATTQGMAVGRNVLGAGLPYSPVPYFWSDQYDLKLQAYGRFPREAELTVIEGDLGSRRFVAQFTVDERVTGIVGANLPGAFRRGRGRVGASVVAP